MNFPGRANVLVLILLIGWLVILCGGARAGPEEDDYFFSDSDEPKADESFNEEDDEFSDEFTLLEEEFFLAPKKVAVAATKREKKALDTPSSITVLTAEDIEYTSASDGDSQKEDEIGIEIMGYLSWKLYQNVEFAINAGYLFAGDAMDYWEEDSIQDGSSDEDIFRSMARVRYKF